MSMTAPNEQIIFKLLESHWKSELDASVQYYIDQCKERLQAQKPEILAKQVMKLMSFYDVQRGDAGIVIRVLNEPMISSGTGMVKNG